MQYFWSTKENIPEDMGFSLYHMPHLLWLGTVIAAVVAMAFLCRQLKQKNARRICIGIAWTMLGLEIGKDLVLWIMGEFQLAYLPLDLCGLSIFLELTAVYVKHPLLLECVYSLSLPGACLALLFPNWISLPFWNFFSLHAVLLHGLLVMLPVILLSTGQLHPNWKRIPFCFFCIFLACIPISVFNHHFGTNFFFLERPSVGSPLEWFAAVFGSHIVGMPILMAIIWTGMYGIPIWISHRFTQNKS